MANYYALARSNYFKVKDAGAFKEWVGSIPDLGVWAIDGVLYKAHRVIWKLVTLEEPDVIDHINGDRSDNRLINLRSTNATGNARNARLRKDSLSGLKGVCFSNTFNKWMAQIRVNTRTRFLGLFDDKYEAHSAYCEAAKLHHEEFANFG